MTLLASIEEALEADIKVHQAILDTHTICPRQHHTGAIAGLNNALDRVRHLLSQPPTDEEVARVAKRLFDKWQDGMECEYTEDWPDYANKDWFLDMARAAITADRRNGR